MRRLLIVLALLVSSLASAAELRWGPIAPTEAAYRWAVVYQAEEPRFVFVRESGDRVLPEVEAVNDSTWVLSLDRECVEKGEALRLIVEITEE